MKNITLSADERLIEEAREVARRRNTTLTSEFREWLTAYVSNERRERTRRAIEETRKVFKTHGPYTRDEMNGRGSALKELGQL
jgi:hypothetical protein